jgi:pre-rRNA-processing protein TSR3
MKSTGWSPLSEGRAEFPPTIIIVHPKEKRSKCTVEPLRARADFVFWTFPQRGGEPLESYVRLGIGGPPLSAADAHRGLLVLDGTWRLAERMEDDFRELPLRSLGPWQTAYPRASKLYDDPLAGLATIEAIFAAYHELGRRTEGLLDEYHWREEFLRRNERLLTQPSRML